MTLDNVRAWANIQKYFMYYEPKIKPSKVFIQDIWEPKKKYDSTKISVTKSDTMDMALCMNMHKPLILIFADADHPGGCVGAGAGMQEESLFRRTSLHKHLIKEELYPIEPLAAIYVPHVETLNGNILDFIACPGIKMPTLSSDFRFCKDDENTLREKIKLIMQVAYDNGHSNLVLGALGCGVWGCPPKHVAEIFRELLLEYNGVFEHICFAILGATYNIFYDILEVLL